MMERKFIGVLTPSSNTALEPLTSAIVSDVPHVSAHFSRFPVTEISMREQSVNQFDPAVILEAAQLLADARVDVICWSGTSAGWLGIERDETLCRQITERTGIPATTAVLALHELMQRNHIRNLGLVTPYIAEVQDLIIDNYRKAGINCIAQAHLGLTVNHEFGCVQPETLATMIRQVAEKQPDAITVLCTNLRAAHIVKELEAELDIPIYDSVAAVVWKAFEMLKINPHNLKGWGRMFCEAQV